MNLRHGVANALYSAASKIDRPVIKWDNTGTHGEPWADIGDSDARHDATADMTTTRVQLHLRADTPISADYQPGRYTYSALKIGRGVDLTLFMTRGSTLRLLGVVQALGAQFDRFGGGTEW